MEQKNVDQRWKANQPEATKLEDKIKQWKTEKNKAEADRSGWYCKNWPQKRWYNGAWNQISTHDKRSELNKYCEDAWGDSDKKCMTQKHAMLPGMVALQTGSKQNINTYTELRRCFSIGHKKQNNGLLLYITFNKTNAHAIILLKFIQTKTNGEPQTNCKQSGQTTIESVHQTNGTYNFWSFQIRFWFRSLLCCEI